jgi:hypothetical protein
MMETGDLVAGPAAAKRAQYINEIAQAALDQKRTLGKSLRADESAERLADMLRKLGEESAEFSPSLGVYHLASELFTDRGILMPVAVAELMSRYDFYLVNVPVTLVPRSGWDFSELECRIAFNVDAAEDRRPVAHELFPKEEWQTLISSQNELSFGIDANLAVNAGVKLPVTPVVGGDASAGAKAGVKSQFIIGPFTYQVRRRRVMTRGKGNVFAYWRLSGDRAADTEDTQLSVVLRVPKDVSVVNVDGVMKASRHISTFGAGFRALLEFVTKGTRDFFERGAPLSDTHSWSAVTATPSKRGG